jgi:hypothetical protein
MNTRVLVASALALSIMTPVAAYALTVDNQDKAPYTLKVTPKGGKEMNVAVKASGHATVDCKNGATIALGSSTETCDAKTAKISIKSGKLTM